jgi:hypothetical protein
VKDRATPKGQGGQVVFTQDDRPALLGDPKATVHRKTARILAVQLSEPFIVYTDRGPMTGQPGDYLVTNHPDDDAGSDLWTISAERMANTYVLADPVKPHPGTPHEFGNTCSLCGERGRLHVAFITDREKVTITEEA